MTLEALRKAYGHAGDAKTSSLIGALKVRLPADPDARALPHLARMRPRPKTPRGARDLTGSRARSSRVHPL